MLPFPRHSRKHVVNLLRHINKNPNFIASCKKSKETIYIIVFQNYLLRYCPLFYYFTIIVYRFDSLKNYTRSPQKASSFGSGCGSTSGRSADQQRVVIPSDRFSALANGQEGSSRHHAAEPLRSSQIMSVGPEQPDAHFSQSHTVTTVLGFATTLRSQT